MNQNPLQQAVQALISAASALLGQQDAQETPPQPASSPNQQESGATTPQNAIQDASAAVNQAASAQNGQNRPESGDSAIQGQTPAQAPATRNTGDSAMNQAASAQQSQYYAPAGPPAGVKAPALTMNQVRGMNPEQINANWEAVEAALAAGK